MKKNNKQTEDNLIFNEENSSKIITVNNTNNIKRLLLRAFSSNSLKETGFYFALGLFGIVMGLFIASLAIFTENPTTTELVLYILCAILTVSGIALICIRPVLSALVHETLGVKPGQKLYALSYTGVIEVSISEYYINSSNKIIYWCEYINPCSSIPRMHYFTQNELFSNKNDAEEMYDFIFEKRVQAFKNIINGSTDETAREFLNSNEFISLANDKFIYENGYDFSESHITTNRFTTIESMLEFLSDVQNTREYIQKKEQTQIDSIKSLNSKW